MNYKKTVGHGTTEILEFMESPPGVFFQVPKADF